MPMGSEGLQGSCCVQVKGIGVRDGLREQFLAA